MLSSPVSASSGLSASLMTLLRSLVVGMGSPSRVWEWGCLV